MKAKLKSLGISFDCTRQQIKICHNQCIYTTIASVEVHCITLALGENTSSAVQARLLTF